MMILTGKTLVSAVRPPYPYGPEFVGQFMFALRLCWFPLLISTIAFGYEAPGLQAANFLVLFGALDRLGGFFVLASIREFAPFVDAIVLAGVAGHRDHRRPRRPQDPRGARRAPGARRRPDQEPRRAAVPGADAGHRPVRHLRGDLRRLRRDPRDARQPRVARPVLLDVLQQRRDDRPVGLGGQDHAVRRDHRRGLLLQGDDRLGRGRGGRPRRQPGGRDRVPGDLRVQLRVHPDAARDPSRDHDDPDDR